MVYTEAVSYTHLDVYKRQILAAMTDIKLAVKENEALLTLAVNLYHKGDIDRSYNYIKVCLLYTSYDSNNTKLVNDLVNPNN